jgi:[glutamine synthetase] adenylyltransferase / [glutamine synthetase]-adenylyl-L-tyrosine phosphorylase
MRDGRSPEAHLAAAGLPVERARGRLADAGLWDDGTGMTAEVREVLEEISGAASPEAALLVVTDLARLHPEVFAEVRADPQWRARLVAVAGASRPLGDLLAQHPNALRGLRAPRPVDPALVATEVETALVQLEEEDEQAAAIARVRRRTTAEIAARDLTGEATVDEVGRDLARLAEGVLTGVVGALFEDPGRPPVLRLSVIGMGKLGGEELNYVSDVDVIFVHEAVDEEEAARRGAQALCQHLIRLLNASTTMGRAYEIDPTLRPEGREGPLSRNLASFTAYWERWARTWEFQALLKARPVAGDRGLGERFLTAAEPYVYPERLAPEVVDEVREMKGRVESKPIVQREGERQIKLGPGGLRDIEFSVQLLQLVHGRADRVLRARGTLPALATLAERGYIAEDDAETFASAYRFLRTVEHRLQLAEERRTHTVPEDPDRLERLARSLGYRAEGDVPAREPFESELRRVQSSVRDVHAKLFYRPLLQLHAVVPAADAALVAPGQRLSDEAAATRVEALGFHDGPTVLRDLRALTTGVSRRAKILEVVLPAFLHALSETPDPDGGLRAFRRLVEGQVDDAVLVAALRDQPPTVQLLALILGTSEMAGELLTGQPQGLEWVTDTTARAEPRRREPLVAAARGLLRWQDDLEQRGTALRRLKRRELTRIVVRDLAGDAPVDVVTAELTALAEACLAVGVEAVLEEHAPQAETPPARIAVVGMGKLGGSELHYVSDLDVIFVHEAHDGVDESDATRFAIAVGEKVLGSLSAVTAEGTAFEIDAELRPEGRSGPLSRSLRSATAYYERWSQTWEHLALLKARHVAGDDELGRRFVELTRRAAYPEGLPPAEEVEIRRMKARIEKERVPRRTDPARHLKLGPGGLSDVEWTVQLLQHRHGGREPMLRTPSTMAALDALQDVGIVVGTDADWLRAGYRFLSEVRNRLYLLRQRDVDALPASNPVLERLARSLGYGRGGRQSFEEDYLRTTRRVRRVTERLFYGSD